MISKTILFTILFALFSSKIHIWEPKALKAIYSNLQFQYSVMDFGSVPYGHSIYGTVFKASPYDACEELAPINWDKNYGTLIILVNRGTCNFSQKVINAQKIGAGLVMVADNNNEDVHKIFPVERTKDQLDKVNIPSILITKQESEDILVSLNKPAMHSDIGVNSSVEMAIHFELTKSDDLTFIKTIVAVDDFRSYDLLLQFEPYLDLFKSYLDFKVHFKLFFNSKQFFGDDDCMGTEEHHYCTSKSFGNDKKGLGLPQETLRQLCLKNFDYVLFIKYIRAVRQGCFNKEGVINDNFKDCTQKTYDDLLSLENKALLQECLNPESGDAKKALSKNHDKIKYFLINYSPIIFINGSYYKGNYDNENHLVESICNSFEEPPAECNFLSLFKTSYYLNTHHLKNFIFLSIAFWGWFALLVIVVFLAAYRKKIRKVFNPLWRTRVRPNRQRSTDPRR